MRTRLVLGVVAVVAMAGLAGCAFLGFVDLPGGEPTSESATAPAPGDGGDLADPEEDVKGWENGVWYNESLPVTPGDGLNESEMAMVVNRSMARVEYVRNVEFERDVPVSVVSREEYRERQTGGGDGDGSGGGGDGEKSAEAVRESVRLEALFLVGESSDAQKEQAETRSASVQGFYSPGDDEITIVAPSETPTVDEITLAHELVHAYQFRDNVDIRFPKNPSRDERRALIALIEGDANLVDRKVRNHCGDAWSCIGHDSGEDADDESPTTASGDGDGGGDGGDADGSGSSGSSGNMGLYLLSYFPYAEGEEYVAATKADGGWEAVNDLYSDPAASSEQVIHRNDDDVRDVSVPDRSADAWSRVGDGSGVVAGEADLASMFAATLYDDKEGSIVTREQFLTESGPIPIDYALPPSSGWAGDSLYAYERDDGEQGYVWRLQFDDEGEAREFADAYREMLRYQGASKAGGGVFEIADGPYADAFYVDVSGTRVTIVNAPSVDALGDVHAPASQRVAPASVDASPTSDDPSPNSVRAEPVGSAPAIGRASA